MLTSGQSIGNYRILAKIGTGGMGAVYLAEHPLIGKKVALKVIHRELAGNREVVQRFFQEARAVNKIGNEHIVEIHDFGVTPENDHFYIMEYLEGQTLAGVLAREKILVTMRALHIGAQIASALAAAHAAGVIHRDLKPDNIMLTMRLGDPDFVKVLDFGLAKMFAAGGAAVNTAIGVLLGTPQYMSPEACESKRDIDHRTDIYALGILLFQMMTGVLPFDGETMGEVLVKQVTMLPPAPRGFNPSIPPSVEQVLLRCLAKPVDLRFPTMQALRDALLDPEAYLRASPPIAPARSVAPGEAGVDAKTVMMHAAQVQAQAQAKTRMVGAGGMPLPAPSQGMAATMISTEMPVARPVPGLVPPTEPKQNTMRIATPMGYSSRPPRRMWPIVLVLGLVLGLGGGAFAVAWVGRGQGSASAVEADAEVSAVSIDATAVVAIDAAAPAPDAAVAMVPAPIDAAAPEVPVTVDAAPASVKEVKLALDSAPRGAAVSGPDGKVLGKTPLELSWPASEKPVTFELRLSGYRKKTKTITLLTSTAVTVQLDRMPRIRPPNGKGSGSDDGNGLIRPE
ncbi:MAG TPA: serine/threonine-protein kinase [Kofleriaceae bacterium]